MKLNAKQQEAVDLIVGSVGSKFRGRIGIITGGPGTGKTTVLKWALAAMSPEERNSVALLAPTGKAAMRITEVTAREATTIHRHLFQCDPVPRSLYIVDETSMVDAELLAALIRKIPEQSSLILIGDANQLPSVGPGRVFGDLIASESVPVIRLTEVQRAKERSWVCQNAPVILNGDIDLMPSGDFLFVEAKGEDEVLDAVKRIWKNDAATNPQGFQLLIPMRRYGLGTEKVNTMLQSARLSTEDEIREDPKRYAMPNGPNSQLWYGDPVIHIKNNYQLSVFNGETGVVSAIRNEESSKSTGVTVTYGKRFVDYNPAVAQDELRLAYAMTIHKSQGSEWDTVAVVCHEAHRWMWNKQLLYTAVTRSRKMVYLIGTESAVRRAITTDAPSTRTTTLQERIRA